jgi:hypothetical protein
MDAILLSRAVRERPTSRSATAIPAGFAMRLAPLALACMRCSYVSTSSYGVAAGFAAAAGVLQVAEAAGSKTRASSCGPKSCSGCCDANDQCVDGTGDDACGMGGAVCHDCAAGGHETCSEGACSSEVGQAGSRIASAGPPRGGRPQPAQLSSPSCRQLIVVCMLGTHSVCGTDANGCPACSCKPDAPLDLQPQE